MANCRKAAGEVAMLTIGIWMGAASARPMRGDGVDGGIREGRWACPTCGKIEKGRHERCNFRLFKEGKILC